MKQKGMKVTKNEIEGNKRKQELGDKGAKNISITDLSK
jgi:hypothetical protein